MDTDFVKLIARSLASFGWRLLDYPELGVSLAEFAERVLACYRRFQQEAHTHKSTDDLVVRAVQHVYCIVLYKAVGMDKTPVQDRALDEIAAYVIPTIRHYLTDDDRIQECANNVRRIIWEKRGQVRDAGSFLYYAMIVARHEALRISTEHKQEILWSDLFPEDDDPDERETQLSERLLVAPSAWQETVENDLDQANWWEMLIRRCLERSPARQEVFIELELRDKEVGEVAERLSIDASYVNVLKFRAIASLRKCRALLEALGRSQAVLAGGQA
jgi:DNA-directed RNA polymerase specialized sigma24 family protein